MKDRAGKSRVLWILALCVFAAAACLALAMSSGGPADQEGVIAWVDGEPVYTEEFEMLMAENRGAVSSYFSQTYGVSPQQGFWTKRYGGETPLHVLKERTLEQVKADKTLQIRAKREGLADEITYPALCRQREEENRRRARDKEAGKAIYGPVEYSPYQFYQYVMNGLQTELSKKYQSETTFGEEEKRAWYEAEKNRVFFLEMCANVQAAYFTYTNEQEKSTARRAADSYRSRLAAGEEFDALQKEFASEANYFETRRFDNRDDGVDKTGNGEARWREVQRLREGQVSPVIEDHAAFLVLRCAQRWENTCLPYEEVENEVAYYMLSEGFANERSGEVQNARVTLNEKAWDAVTME